MPVFVGTGIEQFADDAAAIVTSGGTTAPAAGTSESWTVTAATAFPVATAGEYFYIADTSPAAEHEKILVTSAPGGTGAGQSWTVTRGADGTTPVTHAAGFAVVQVVTAASLQALAAGAGLLAQTAVKTANYTAAAGQIVPVNTTSGAVTVTLPAAPAAGTLVAVKHVIQGGTNAVTVAAAGSDVFNKAGGSTSGTLSLASQGMLLQYQSGIWMVLADDLPLTQLDGRYLTTFSPMNYGAVGNGTTDDTVAVKAAFAAAGAVCGTVDLGNKIYLTSSAINPPSFITIRGANLAGGQQSLGGTIVNHTSDIFALNAVWTGVLIENCSFIASAGHVFNIGSAYSVSSLTVDGVWINQTSASHSIWYQTGGPYIGNSWGVRKVCILSASATASVSPWYFQNGGSASSFNNNYFGMMRAVGNGANVPFFTISMDVNAGVSEEVTFDQVIFEVCNGGGIAMTGATNVLINCCANWDQTATTGNFYSFTKSANNQPCSYIQVKAGRAAVLSGSGFYDVYCDSFSYHVLVDTLYNGNGARISSPANLTTIINTPLNGTGNSAAVTAPCFAPTGDTAATGSVAAARYLAATTGGAPGSGTYKIGDVVPDQTGAMWVCTGTPRTFAQVGSASGTIQPADVGVIAWTANPGYAIANDQWAAGLNGAVIFWRVKIGAAATIANVSYIISSGGAGAGMSNIYFGIYSLSGSAATLLGTATPDQSTNMAGTGPHTAALGTTAAVTPGIYAVGLLIGAASTMPKFLAVANVNGAGSGTIANLGLSSANYLTASSTATGLTALPGTATASTPANAGLPILVMT